VEKFGACRRFYEGAKLRAPQIMFSMKPRMVNKVCAILFKDIFFVSVPRLIPSRGMLKYNCPFQTSNQIWSAYGNML
jgi:hypothetical protein